MSGWGINSHPEIDAIRRRANSGPRIDYLPDDAEQSRCLRIFLLPLRWDVVMEALVLFVVTAAFLTAVRHRTVSPAGSGGREFVGTAHEAGQHLAADSPGTGAGLLCHGACGTMGHASQLACRKRSPA